MFTTRIKKLKEQIKKQKLDAVFISSHASITYLSGYSNFSKDEREAYIIVGEDFEYIITDGRYAEVVKKEVAHLKLFKRGFEKKTEDLLKDLKNRVKILGIEEDNLTVSEHKILKKYFKNLKHFSISRSIKTKEEIKKIENACKLGDKTFSYILGKIKTGITERELAFEIEFFIRKNGGELSFPAIAAFGKNSSIPHHQTGDKRLTINDKLVLLDFGVNYKNYCSDMTRTVFFGKPTGKQRKIYQTVLEAQNKTVDFINKYIKRGKQIKAKEVDRAARKYIISKGFPSIPHSLGHGIGLEVHEHPHFSPKSKEVLEEGMVFSIEPGIYIEGVGGVRIEDLYLLEKGELKQLTHSSKDLISV